jgi:hypothetical protein
VVAVGLPFAVAWDALTVPFLVLGYLFVLWAGHI